MWVGVFVKILENEFILWIREDLVSSDRVIFLQEVCSPFQIEFTECNLVLPLSISSILSFP